MLAMASPEDDSSPPDETPHEPPERPRKRAREAHIRVPRTLAVPSLFDEVGRALDPFINSSLNSTILPEFRSPFESLSRQISAHYTSQLNDMIAPLASIGDTLNQAMGALWTPTFHQLSETFRKIRPPNWGDASPPDWEDLQGILAHEGIAVMWVPGPEAVAALFEAETAADRRQVISRRWKGIVTDCETALASVNHPQLAAEREFALDCVNALREGHARPAQALAANLLDTVLRKYFSTKTRVALTRNDFKTNGVSFDFDEYRFRVALTFAPVWCAHAKYWEDKGDPIPSTYGRHPSAHAVSRTQYKRINAVMALMVVTSVIAFFDDALRRREAAK